MMLPLYRTQLTALVAALIVAVGCMETIDWEDGECQEGELDPHRYCDRTGDLVADPPPNAEDWLDPDTLIFAYTPVEDPAQYRDVWNDFLDHLQQVTGRNVQFFAAHSNAAQIEAMRAGRLHIAGFSTGAVPLAVNCAGFVPTTMMADYDDFGYEMEIITHADSDLEEISDLTPDHTFAFTSQTSNSGFKTPSVFLEEEHGFVAEQDYDVEFSGGHDNSLLGVYQRDYDAAAVANEVTDRIMARGEVPADQIRMLYRSDTFPTTAFGYAHNLNPELADDIRRAFLTFRWRSFYPAAMYPTGADWWFTAYDVDTRSLEGFQQGTFNLPWRDSTLSEEFSDSNRFKPIEFKTDWEMIRDVDAVFEDGYSCR